ncbi:HU family DNA-binding protein [bacterium endosymbiont of Pedicinus badii]|uniref:HU family DNA-binding protein n=1 Tax=bacterium endosymbiont of Pedicinus badii TaxID=1719126 RepID=UPI0009B9CF13|nr:HU family DNA-binding protein [bacterium endosymbiont of Pedicinus badii]OQM34347.1 hypothetical protein AOQ89_00410 [bacterium endosymbiont of Pedicinus badii]
MNKKDLIKILYIKNKKIAKSTIQNIVTNTIDLISSNLSKGKKIELRGFGVFFLKYFPPRILKHPKTKKSFKTEGKYIPKFRASRKLKDAIKKK